MPSTYPLTLEMSQFGKENALPTTFLQAESYSVNPPEVPRSTPGKRPP